MKRLLEGISLLGLLGECSLYGSETPLHCWNCNKLCLAETFFDYTGLSGSRLKKIQINFFIRNRSKDEIAEDFYWECLGFTFR